MTRDEILAMEPGPELNELIAIEIFGQPKPPYVHELHIDARWDGHWVCWPDYDEGDVCNWRARDFSGDWAAVSLVTEAMMGKYFSWGAEMIWYDGPNYVVWFANADSSYEYPGALTFPEAVCKASLLAVEELKCL